MDPLCMQQMGPQRQILKEAMSIMCILWKVEKPTLQYICPVDAVHLSIRAKLLSLAVCCEQHGSAAEAVSGCQNGLCGPCEALSCDDVQAPFPAQ